MEAMGEGEISPEVPIKWEGGSGQWIPGSGEISGENWALIEKWKVYVTNSCPALCDPMDYIAHQAPLFMEFSRQESCSR